MIAAERELLIAAPSITEILLGAPKSALPRTRGIQVVAFDEQAAILLAEHFPKTVLVELQKELQRPRAYIKYDALIAACALRHHADVLISADAAQRSVATRAGLKAYEPAEYWSKQPRLPNVK